MKTCRSNLMRRAWADLPRHLSLHQINGTGRHCFAWALSKAWAEVWEAARIAAIAPTVRQTRIEALNAAIEREQFNDCWPQARANMTRMRAEISQLQVS